MFFVKLIEFAYLVTMKHFRRTDRIHFSTSIVFRAFFVESPIYIFTVCIGRAFFLLNQVRVQNLEFEKLTNSYNNEFIFLESPT